VDVELIIVNNEDLGAAFLLLDGVGEQAGPPFLLFVNISLIVNHQHICILFDIRTFNQRLRHLDLHGLLL